MSHDGGLVVYGGLVVLHLIGACVWTGGHLILSCWILPQAAKTRDASLVYRLESAYNAIGIPALVAQVLTGLILGYSHVRDVGFWFDLDSPMGHLIGLKVLLLLLTLALGLDVRYRLLPRIGSDGLNAMKWHFGLITVVSVALVFVGASFRIGWLY